MQTGLPRILVVTTYAAVLLTTLAVGGFGGSAATSGAPAAARAAEPAGAGQPRLAVATSREVGVWNAAQGFVKLAQTPRGSLPITSLRWAPEGRFLAWSQWSPTGRGTRILWADTHTRQVHGWQLRASVELQALVVSSRGVVVLATGDKNTVRLFSFAVSGPSTAQSVKSLGYADETVTEGSTFFQVSSSLSGVKRPTIRITPVSPGGEVGTSTTVDYRPPRYSVLNQWSVSPDGKEFAATDSDTTDTCGVGPAAGLTVVRLGERRASRLTLPRPALWRVLDTRFSPSGTLSVIAADATKTCGQPRAGRSPTYHGAWPTSLFELRGGRLERVRRHVVLSSRSGTDALATVGGDQFMVSEMQGLRSPTPVQIVAGDAKLERPGSASAIAWEPGSGEAG